MVVILSKLVSAFLLPPGVFVLFFGWLAWFLRPRRSGRGCFPFILAIVSGGGLYLVSTELVADFLIQPLEDRYPPFPAEIAADGRAGNPRIDAIVVLGGGTVAHSPEMGRDDLEGEALKRLLYALRIHRRFRSGPAAPPLVFSGGRVFDVGQDAEAAIMSRYAAEWGVDPGSILLELDSRTTWQNARNVSSRFRVQSIVLVTSAYHMSRAVWCFEGQGIEVVPAPTDYKVNRGVPYDFESFLPTLRGFEYFRRALHEYLGLFLYRMVYR
ncbi:MAG: YdcF family protein [Spirochaetales bacterium]